jgi:3-oxoacyl-[acyl-carrier protein] reductase
VLVNNAGVFQFDPVEEITEKEFHREFDTKVLGTILATQQALKHFPRTGGSIIKLSSIASQNPVPNSSLYSATKGAIDTLTLALAKELGPRNIRVNTVAPGLIDTEGNRKIGFVGSMAGMRLRFYSTRRTIRTAGGSCPGGGFPGLRRCVLSDW